MWSFFSPTAPAQNLSPQQDYVNTFAQPGQSTITIYLWGTVGSPGIWRVERGVDLVSFLSAVQIPGLGAADQDVRRNFELHIYRTQSGDRRQIYVEDVENLLAGGAQPYPPLQDGDILVIETETRRRLSFRTVFEIVRTTASLITLYFLLDDRVF